MSESTFMDQLIADIREREAWPWWKRTAHEAWRQLRVEAKHWPRTAYLKMRWAWQRLTRGWDDHSVWGLDTWLGTVVGAQLAYMADIAHGSPMDYPGDFDGWVADLRRHGEALKRHGEGRLDDLLADRDREIYLTAQESMRWVAENFGALWD